MDSVGVELTGVEFVETAFSGKEPSGTESGADDEFRILHIPTPTLMSSSVMIIVRMTAVTCDCESL